MTRDDIILMAQEANRYANSQTEDRFDWQLIRDERFADLISAAEREACARVCEQAARGYQERGMDMAYAASEWIEAAIRARNQA